ncbi:LysE family translocator [Stappia indica]|uniref:LysE family translocator n=1 Tax=Stappia indica TaxID=538381 RepID=UPI0021E5B156
MIDLALFGKSLVLGLAIAAPLGPIGALCINRTLERGFWAGLSGGLGTALADAVYASFAAVGFAAFAAGLAIIDAPLRLIGGAFMIWLGVKALSISRVDAPAARVGARDLIGTVAATFFLTITNPMTILAFAAIFAGLGLAEAPGAAGAASVVSGVFFGSLLWWGLLSGGVAIMRHRVSAGFARWSGIASSVVLIAFGVFAIGSLAGPLVEVWAGG